MVALIENELVQHNFCNKYGGCHSLDCNSTLLKSLCDVSGWDHSCLLQELNFVSNLYWYVMWRLFSRSLFLITAACLLCHNTSKLALKLDQTNIPCSKRSWAGEQSKVLCTVALTSNATALNKSLIRSSYSFLSKSCNLSIFKSDEAFQQFH